MSGSPRQRGADFGARRYAPPTSAATLASATRALALSPPRPYARTRQPVVGGHA